MTLSERAISASRRTRMPVAFALIDVDHFKEINDRYGHSAGDDALLHLAKICKSEFRTSDIISRIGGDEFCIVLLDTDIIKASVLLNRLLRKLEEIPFISGESEIAFTLSIGIASSSGIDDIDEILARADSAMYDAKKTGRHKVCTTS